MLQSAKVKKYFKNEKYNTAIIRHEIYRSLQDRIENFLHYCTDLKFQQVRSGRFECQINLENIEHNREQRLSVEKCRQEKDEGHSG